jgi:hypothetical protein
MDTPLLEVLREAMAGVKTACSGGRERLGLAGGWCGQSWVEGSMCEEDREGV